jgi:Cu2+-exporting ATPase
VPSASSLSQVSVPEHTHGAEACFHCGLPVPGDIDTPTCEILGSTRHFCCAGCHAVADAIVSSGLEDYYRFRTEKSATANMADIVPDFIERLQIYDRPEVQKGFVRSLVNGQEASLLLEEVRCPACLWLNERHVRQQPGVIEVTTDAATQRMRVRWDSSQIQLSDILRSIADIGYIAHPYDASHSEQLNVLRKRRSIERLIFAGILGMMVMNFSIATYVMGEFDAEGGMPLWITIGRWTSLFVCLTLLAYPGQDFFIGAWRDLRNRKLGMDIPIVLGLSVAFTGSLHATITGHGEVYLDSIAMFIFFVLFARYFETRGRVRSAAFMDKLAQAVPAMARKIDDEYVDGHEVAVMDLLPGDIVLILPGEQVPVDGEIIHGSSSFDESLLTGESVPVYHGVGDPVVAGSINGEQAVKVEVNKTAGTTTIDQISRLIDEGLEQRPQAARLAEKAARWFVLAILIIASMTASYWYLVDPLQWLPNTIAVLIVTCPCALALATPVSLAIGAGRFINAGILPLRMSALDGLARSEQIVFDKTGTLTTGQFKLTKIHSLGQLSDDKCLVYARALVNTSEHPVARTIRQVNVVGVLPASEIHNEPGHGVEGTLDGQRWRFGRPDFANVITGSVLPQEVLEYEQQGYTVSLLTNEAGVQALFALEDSLRTEATSLIPDLIRFGFKKISILSGDAKASVARVGRLTGINNLHSRMTPTGKLSWMRDQQRDKHSVVMVGDGINDAPTLAAADVSISLASSTDLANASSDFLLLNDDIGGVMQASRLSRLIYTNIRQNLLWAVAYNVIAVPLAAAGYIAPWAAAIGMSVSSIIVVANALRLQSK